MKKIKIAYITKDLSINGISTVVMNLSRLLNKEIYNVTIMAGSPIDHSYEEECKKIGIKIVKLPQKRGGNPLKYYKKIFQNIKEEKYDIVHVHGNSATITVELLIAKICKTPVKIGHSHNTTCDKKIIHRILKGLLNKLCDFKVACGIEAGKWLFGEKEFYVLKNGIFLDKYIFNEKNREEIRHELKISNNELVVGHVGKFNYQKNQEFLVDLFKNKELSKSIKLLLVGTGENFDYIKKIASDNVILYGESSTPEKLYSAMDLFVLPSRFEGLPLTAIEAQANGLKCILSDKIDDKVNVTDSIIFLPIEDSKEWAKTIKQTKLYDRKIVCHNNIAKIKKAGFDIKVIVDGLSQKYTELLEDRKKIDE